MGVRRYTTRLLVLVCLLGDLGGEGGRRGGVPSFGCGKGEFGRGSGPKNWRGWGVIWGVLKRVSGDWSVYGLDWGGCDGFEGWGRVMWGGVLGMGVFVIGMGWLVWVECGDSWI